MQNQSVVPCSGWYFVAKNSGDDSDIVFPVAAWSMNESGEVIGLISVTNAVTKDNIARLVAPPPIGGTYKHERQLDTREKTVARLA